MTTDKLKAYLKALPGAGVAAEQMDSTADIAIEAGYAAVWGAHTWKVRRIQTDSKTTTGSQAHTVMPDDFESLLGVRIVSSSNPRGIDLIDEEAFDLDFPYPANDSENMPSVAKATYDGSTNLWRIYWYPVPDSAYTLSIRYDRKADAAMLPTLPSHMMPAVVAMCASFMFSDGVQRQAYDQLARGHIQRAVMSDRAISGGTPTLGADPGWDDWNGRQGGGSQWVVHDITD